MLILRVPKNAYANIFSEAAKDLRTQINEGCLLSNSALKVFYHAICAIKEKSQQSQPHPTVLKTQKPEKGDIGETCQLLWLFMPNKNLN